MKKIKVKAVKRKKNEVAVGEREGDHYGDSAAHLLIIFPLLFYFSSFYTIQRTGFC